MTTEKTILEGLIDMDWQITRMRNLENHFLGLEDMNEEKRLQQYTILEDRRTRADVAEEANDEGQTYVYDDLDRLCDFDESPF